MITTNYIVIAILITFGNFIKSFAQDSVATTNKPEKARIFVMFMDSISTANQPDITRFFIGFTGTYLVDRNTGAIFQVVDKGCITNIPTAYGDGGSFGLNLKYTFGGKSSNNHSISLRFLYESIATTKEILNGDFIVYDLKKYIYKLPSYMSADINVTYISLSPLYSYKISSAFPLEISAGPYLSFVINSNFIQELSVVNNLPIDLKDKDFNPYPMGKKTVLVLYNKEISNLNEYLYGLKFNLSYSLNLSDNLIINPEIGYNLSLSNLTKNTNWKITSYYIGFSLLFGIY
jgi:hypothetical protein